VRTCEQCGHDNPPGARFCNHCGAALPDAEPPREVRKTVTVVFCDMVGSTELGGRLDPEVMRQLVAGFYAAVRGPVERHGGTVEKVIGDALMAVFGTPVVHEDDALRAVTAALEMRDAVRALDGIQARIGVNTGDVLARDATARESLVVGDAVNVAARLEQAAAPGEVLVGEETWALVEHAVEGQRVPPIAAKGKDLPLVAWRLDHVDPTAGGHRRRLDVPMIGRDEELELLGHACGRARRTGRPHLVMVLGQPGIGKSRLLGEIPQIADGAVVLTGQCRASAAGSSLQPLVEAAREPLPRIREVMAGDPDADAVAACLAGDRPAGRDVAWAFSRLAGAMSAAAPVVLVVEDVHWADDLLLDAIDQLVGRGRRGALTVVCTARPEFADRRPGWGAGANTISFTLERLDDGEMRRLVDHVGPGLKHEHVDRVVALAEGNPLFAEHMAALVGDAEAEAGPPRSIQVLLAARLEALPDAERDVMGAAAVVGRDFELPAVEALTGRRIDEDVGRLEERELVEITGPGTARFGHALLQEAAYGLLPKQRRCDLHLQLARWLDGDGATDAVIGEHLDRAFGLRTELGEAEAAAELRREAGVRLAAAGRRADAYGDPMGACRLLERALELLAEPSPERAAAMVELGAAGWNLLPRDDVRRLLVGGEELAAALGLRALELRARIVRLGGDDSVADEELRAFAQAAVPELDALGDLRALASALCTVAELDWVSGRAAAGEAQTVRAIEALRAIDDDVVWALRILFLAVTESPTPVAQAEALIDRLLKEFGLRPAARAELVHAQASMSVLSGREEEARRLLDAGRELDRELGRDPTRRLFTESPLLFRAGWHDELEAAYSALAHGPHSSWSAVLRARLALLEARRGGYGRVGEALDTADAYEAKVLAQTAQAEMLAGTGHGAAAVAAAHMAVALADAGDWILLRADSRLTLARVLAAAGDPAAQTAASEARDLFAAKGFARGVAEAELLLASS
jgi:class 3 adenylate cyclase